MKEKNDVLMLGVALLRIEEAKEKQLSKLDLSRLGLAEIPGEVFELTGLQKLYFSDNWLTELPREISGLKNLKVLDLGYNQLTELPREISGLKNLQLLYLKGNRLTQLPKEIVEMKELRELYLHYNQLTQLPKEIAQLENLEILILEGNENLISPPPAVVKQGLKAVLEYLKALEEKTTVWASKMVLVGEGGVGKTCLLDALEGKDFVPGKDTTHGIDTRKLNLPCPDRPGISMELNVWDFGGQEIYHATHQFYLTNHALFILVWSARLGYEAGKIYKWLETIEALAPDSPILMDQTCPNLFTLKPKDAKFYKKSIDVDEFEIQLYCQHPGKIHPVPKGKYTIKIPKKWLKAIAPYYTKMLKIMKWALPIVQPAAKEILDETVLEEMESSIGLIKNYAGMMPGIKPDETDLDLEERSHDQAYLASGPELRLLREILGKKDTGSHWGGLDRVVTPGGHILWLCKEHAKEYK